MNDHATDWQVVRFFLENEYLTVESPNKEMVNLPTLSPKSNPMKNRTSIFKKCLVSKGETLMTKCTNTINRLKITWTINSWAVEQQKRRADRLEKSVQFSFDLLIFIDFYLLFFDLLIFFVSIFQFFEISYF